MKPTLYPVIDYDESFREITLDHLTPLYREPDQITSAGPVGELHRENTFRRMQFAFRLLDTRIVHFWVYVHSDISKAKALELVDANNPWFFSYGIRGQIGAAYPNAPKTE